LIELTQFPQKADAEKAAQVFAKNAVKKTSGAKTLVDEVKISTVVSGCDREQCGDAGRSTSRGKKTK